MEYAHRFANGQLGQGQGTVIGPFNQYFGDSKSLTNESDILSLIHHAGSKIILMTNPTYYYVDMSEPTLYIPV